MINELSFQYKFFSKKSAVNAVHQWLDICKELSASRIRRVQEIYGNPIDTSAEITPDYKIIQLIQEFRDREERSRLLGILLNSRSYAIESEQEIWIDGKISTAGAFVYQEGLLISLNSNIIFCWLTIGSSVLLAVIIHNITVMKIRSKVQ